LQTPTVLPDARVPEICWIRKSRHVRKTIPPKKQVKSSVRARIQLLQADVPGNPVLCFSAEPDGGIGPGLLCVRSGV
jgi:hypothetical protein